MAINDIKDVKQEIAKAVREHMPDANSETVAGYSGLVLKKILSLPYFKGNYDYIKVYHQEDVDGKFYYSLAHPNVNHFQNVNNETMSPVKFHFETENDTFFKIDEKDSRILYEKEKESLSRSLDFLRKAEDIEDVKKYFEKNEKDFYLFMSVYREYSFFGHRKNMVDTLRGCVDLDNPILKNSYKIETFGKNNNNENFKMDTFAVRDHFFYDLNGILGRDKKRVHDIILDPMETSGGDFEKIVFGDLRQYMQDDAIMSGKINDDSDKESIETEKTKRKKLMDRVKKNKKIYDNSLLKILEETPQNKHHAEFYNKFLFTKQRKKFFDSIENFINKKSLENVFEENKELLDDVYEKTLKAFPEFLAVPEDVSDFKIKKAIKTKDGEMYDLLEQLSDAQSFHLYDIVNEDFGGKNMKYFMVDRGMYNSPRVETTLYATHGDLEVVSINHFTPSAPVYGRNDESNIGLEILTYNNIAEHFKGNEALKNTMKEEILNYVEDKKIILDVSRMKRDMPAELLEEAINKENVFIATDGPLPDGMEIYYRGINTIRDALFDNSLYESKKAITKDSSQITYDKMLEIRKEFTKLYREKLEKYEIDYSLMDSSDFEKKSGENIFEFRETIDNVAALAAQNVFSNDAKNKKTKKNRMS
jgi:hypothetical protein